MTSNDLDLNHLNSFKGQTLKESFEEYRDTSVTFKWRHKPSPHYRIIAKRNHNAAFIIWYINYCILIHCFITNLPLGLSRAFDRAICPESGQGLGQGRPSCPDYHFLCFCILPERYIMRIKTHFKCQPSLNTIHWEFCTKIFI